MLLHGGFITFTKICFGALVTPTGPYWIDLAPEIVIAKLWCNITAALQPRSYIPVAICASCWHATSSGSCTHERPLIPS